MKKVILMVAAVLMSAAAAEAQTFRMDEKSYLDAIARSDADIAHPKRSLRGQTWMDRAEAMFKAAAGGYELLQVFPGQERGDLAMRIGSKIDSRMEEVNGNMMEVLMLPYADIYLQNDVVQFWVDKANVYEGAEDKAVEAYRKAAELDPKLIEKAQKGISSVGDLYGIQGNANNFLGNKLAAAENYWRSFQIKRSEPLNVVDSISVFNAGYIFLTDDNNEKAIEILSTALDAGVWEGGKTPYFLSHAYMRTEQLDKMKEVLTKGLEMFPDDKGLIENMVNYYILTKGDFGEIKGLLEKSLADAPDNISLWAGLAQVHMQEGDSEKSMEFFTRFQEKFPEEVQANFYLGDAWYERGSKIEDDARNDKTMSAAAVKEADEKAKEAYRQAWKYLDKAYQSQPDEKAVLQRYTFVTARLIEDPGMEELYEKLEGEYKAAMGIE